MDISVPSLEEVLEAVEEVVMELLEGPVLVDPEEPWKVEKAVRIFMNVDADLGVS